MEERRRHDHIGGAAPLISECPLWVESGHGLRHHSGRTCNQQQTLKSVVLKLFDDLDIVNVSI